MADLKKNLMLEIPSPSMNNFMAHGAGPDLLLFLLTAKQSSNVAHIDEPLAFFREHNNSATIKLRRTKEFLINSCYMQARIWFVESYMSSRLKSMSIAKAWLIELVENRKLSCLRPSKVFEMYTENSKDISLFYFIIGAFTTLFRAFQYKIVRDFIR